MRRALPIVRYPVYLVLFTLGLIKLPSAVYAGELTDSTPCKQIKTRPCVALVLGGGGARGSAHIGVLQAIEELALPVDLVVGTSIGSLVGGLYASGKTSSEIRHAFRSIDWNSGYHDALSRSQIPIRRKHQLDYMPIHLDLGFDRSGLHLPTGIIQGQSMKHLVDEMLGKYPQFASFDQLSIPFRAVAADAETGEQVILSRGDLATAMQISMSLPGIVRPTRYEGRLLVDGGVAANLPISVAQELGADIVIAVDIGSPSMTQNELNSAFTILRQLTSFLTHRNVDDQKALLDQDDLLLKPNIEGVGLLSFDKTLEAIDAGYQEAKSRLLDQPSLVSLFNAASGRVNQSRASQLPDKTRLDQVIVNNNTRLSDTFIIYRLGLIYGNYYSLEDIQKATSRLYGQGTIARIRTYWDVQAQKNILFVEVDEKEWGPGYTNFRLAIEDDFRKFSRYQLGLSYLRSNLNPSGAEWYSEVEIGSEKRLFTELNWPLWSPNIFSFASWEYTRDVLEATEKTQSLGSTTMKETTVEAGLGWSNADHLLFEAGLYYGDEDVSIPVGLDDELADAGFSMDSYDVVKKGYLARLHYDTLDHANFPSSGAKLSLAVRNSRDEFSSKFVVVNEDSELYNTDIDINIKEHLTEYDLRFTAVGSIGRHALRGNILYQGKLEDSDTSVVGGFELGGFLSLSGTPHGYLSQPHVRFASAVYTYQLAENQIANLKLPVYVGASLEAGKATRNKDKNELDHLLHSGSVFVGWNSPLGPTYLAYGRSDAGLSSFYFFLGQTF